MDAIEQKLAALGLQLPEPVKPAFEYVPVAIHGEWAYVSGQLPRLNAHTVVTGKLGVDLDVERGREAARLCTLHALANLRSTLGTLERIAAVVKLTGFVASAPGFTQQPQVVDGASRLLADVFGERGRHARSAVGVAELPRGAAVEIEMIVALRG
ncbi:MAG TPA: RidA family protein [Burkholderiales bacterium]|jgi:enamine deaminase RidA (YjgF/YER057c/UK114 family)|nr:RidA family protein [Burkholderiales bacterium]